MGDLSSCGCNNNCNSCDSTYGRSGNNSWLWIIILLFCCGGCGGNSGGFGLFGGSGCGDNDNSCCNIIIWILILSCVCGNGSGLFGGSGCLF